MACLYVDEQSLHVSFQMQGSYTKKKFHYKSERSFTQQINGGRKDVY